MTAVQIIVFCVINHVSLFGHDIGIVLDVCGCAVNLFQSHWKAPLGEALVANEWLLFICPAVLNVRLSPLPFYRSKPSKHRHITVFILLTIRKSIS